ncbi:MAG TPA: hypothetical protein VGD31_00020 [Sphingobacteriaceae bacterium]
MSETVLVFRDIKYARGVFSADLSNRTFNDVKLQLKALENERIIILDSPGFSYPTPDISNDLRLAVYGFPIDHDLKYKTLYFMPLKYVFFNEETAEVYSAKYASNGFAKYFSDNTALPSVPTKLIQKTIAFAFVGDASTKKYYPLQCDQVAQIKADSRVYFESKSEVEADGYRPDKCTTMTQLPAPRYNQPVIGMSFPDFEKVCPMKPKYSQSRETEYGKSTGFIYKTGVANCNGMFIFRNGFLVLIEKEGDF